MGNSDPRNQTDPITTQFSSGIIMHVYTHSQMELKKECSERSFTDRVAMTEMGKGDEHRRVT